MIVNKRNYDWSSIDVKFSDFECELQEISYDDELEKEESYGKGKAPRGFGTGNYKASGKMSMLRDDFNDLLDYCKSKNKTLYGLLIPKIVVAYANEGQKTRVDTLSQVTITKITGGGAQGDKSLKVDMDFLIVGGIDRDGVKAI
ncbi:MAG: hypothetical protein ACI4LO_01950 [Anaerovoracaceae bacterium]